MKKWNKSLFAIAAAVCVGTAGLASGALATEAGAKTTPGYSEDSNQYDRWQVLMTKKHNQLHDKLNLSADQEGAWKTYTDATMTNMTQSKRGAVDLDSMSAPQRMEKGLEFMNERLKKMAAQLDALKTFYATLTPEQQKVFDAETSPKKWHEKARDHLKRKQKPSSK